MAITTLANHFKLVFGLPDGEAPSEFRIFAYGTTGTTKGDYEFHEVDADEVMRAYSDHGNRLTIDYEHQALNDPPTGPAPAAASFVLQKRADGLWATDVKWSPRAAEMLKNKEYLYFSPAFLVDDNKHPNRLLNVALTNLPATKNMTPLVAAKHVSSETTMKTVLSALSLKDSASEAEALSAVTKLGQLVTVTGKSTADEALGVIAAWKEQAAESVVLKAQVAKQKADHEAASFETEFIAAQKLTLLAPSDEHKRNKHALSLKGKEGALVQLRNFLATLDPMISVPKSAPAGSEPATGAPVVVSLTDEEKRIADKMHLSHEAVLKNKIRLASKAKHPVVAADDDDDQDAA